MSENKCPMEQVWDLRLKEVSQALEENGFTVTTLPSRAEAVKYFKESIMPELKPQTVALGGSVTVANSGLVDILMNTPGLKVYNHGVPGLSAEEAFNIKRQGFLSDLYVCSSNALLRDGTLLNLDGGGNRVAALTFGPKKVVLFVGRNKICEDLEAARQRIQEFAAPANNIRLNRKTPCTKKGSCMDCSSPERICNTWVLTKKSAPVGRVHVLLINEDVGF